MYFNTCEHYNDDKKNEYYNIYNISEHTNDECFICFEVKDEYDLNSIKLRNQKLYYTKCICDASVHNYCLEKWIKSNNRCPICRVIIYFNIMNEQNIIMYCLNINETIFCFIIKTFNTLFKCLFLLIIFYLINEFSFLILEYNILHR
jgi:hypothetical protein